MYPLEFANVVKRHDHGSFPLTNIVANPVLVRHLQSGFGRRLGKHLACQGCDGTAHVVRENDQVSVVAELDRRAS